MSLKGALGPGVSLSLSVTWPRCSEALLGACPQVFLGPHRTLSIPPFGESSASRQPQNPVPSLFADPLFLLLAISPGTMAAAFPGVSLPVLALLVCYPQQWPEPASSKRRNTCDPALSGTKMPF